MLRPVNADLDLALRLADTADAITLSRFRASDLRVERKPDRTPVTDADTAAEDALRAQIAAERPDDEVVGEERGGELTAGGRAWVLDPIDGTKNYSRGLGVWGSLIALTEHGEPTVGVASSPALGRRWWAARGEGAWTSDGPGRPARRIAVSGVRELADAYLSTTDFRVFVRQGRGEQYQRLATSCWETRAFGDFWQYCLVAEGVIDLAVDPVANPWDLAAVAPIVVEAGGAFTDLGGAPRFDGGDGLASNGAVHDAALAIIGTRA
jgi:histidinol-phosphatase